jgi:hypothetical protein
MDIPPKYESKEEEAAKWALLQSIVRPPTAKPSAQGRPSTIKKPSSKPFRVALVMSRMSESYIDSKDALQPSKRLKVRCGSTMICRDTTETKFRRLMWECIYDTFKLRGWTRAPRTDAELASGKKYATADEWTATIAHLMEEKDAGQHPVQRISFSFKKGERVKLETESKLSFSLKRLLDRVFGR